MDETLLERKERLLAELEDTNFQIENAGKFEVEIDKNDDGSFDLELSKGSEDGAVTVVMEDLEYKDLVTLHQSVLQAVATKVNIEDMAKEFDELFKTFVKHFQ